MAYNTRGYGMTTYRAVGDPFLGGIIKGIGKVAGGAVKGFLGGGPLGAITGGVGAIVGGGGAMPAPASALPTLSGRPISVGGSVALPPFGFPKISGGLQLGAPTVGLSPVPGGAAGVQKPAGYHINKSGYWLKTGQYVAPGTRWVRNRRTNPANGRALRRAVRRTQGFNNQVKRARKSLRALARI